MRAIFHERVTESPDGWLAECVCGKINKFSQKNNAIQMAVRGSCRFCKKDYRSTKDKSCGIYLNKDGKWCSRCDGCEKEQAYTRKDHAKQSFLQGWQCKTCVQQSKAFQKNQHVGGMHRLFNKFKKSAKNRNIDWSLTFDEFCSGYTGYCALTNWNLSLKYSNTTASLDRINSSVGYTPENIQWVHSMINMCKNKYTQDKFIEMCKAVADREKW